MLIWVSELPLIEF